MDKVPIQIKLVTFLSSASSVFFHPGMSPAWYQMMERHMVLATMALSTGEEDKSGVSHVQLGVDLGYPIRDSFGREDLVCPSDYPQVFGGCERLYSYVRV